ncbi:Methylated-DNA--protein-cysteine methyltransferase, constitutive [Kordia antarctica]|uniref:Methylated-DNA--protein-cysteine methyltransferase n=1 Tax=Kordia antarctica TaxID=1218801 RepID=A0A7L4ZKV7_9FLAO|nr:methylated-DNA--[protein]-cysteine S-methyltransferase [Kordia antarctica]QHI37358.1 Methylated-DNA--protein-cysteine methyltransferase, constitutive [Kordia antarctica]
MNTYTAHIKTPLGIARIVSDDTDILEISVLDATTTFTDSEQIPEILQDCVTQLHEYFDGIRTNFELPLAPKGTEFQQKVWKGLNEIPFGKTCSYLDLSKRLGNVKAIRAVASANGKNPLWIVTPCHRVIGSDGSLTGYAGGLWRKKWLLAHESPAKQQSLF